MPIYIQTDTNGKIIASADWKFPGCDPSPVPDDISVERYPNGGLYLSNNLPDVYGKPGTSEQKIEECPEGFILMNSLKPERQEGKEDYIAQEDGTWVIPEKTLDDLKQEKLQEINEKYSMATESLVATYPDVELLTFDKQEQEARAWLQDNEVSTPFIDALCLGRSMEKEEMVSRIIKKADTFSIVSGVFTGQRQHYEDLLGQASSKEEIDAINPEYSISEEQLASLMQSESSSKVKILQL